MNQLGKKIQDQKQGNKIALQMRKSRAEALKQKRTQSVLEKMAPKSSQENKWVDQKMKDKIIGMRMKVKADEMFKEQMQAEKVREQIGNIPERAKKSAKEALEADDAVMDGVEAVLTGDTMAAVNSFMETLKKNPNDPVCAYNLCCCFSIMKQTDNSIRWFEFCVKWGIAQHRELGDPLGDPDLAFIRDNPKFLELVATLHAEKDAIAGGADH